MVGNLKIELSMSDYIELRDCLRDAGRIPALDPEVRGLLDRCILILNRAIGKGLKEEEYVEK